MNSAFVGYIKNYADLGGCYPPRPSASITLLDLHIILHILLSLIH